MADNNAHTMVAAMWSVNILALLFIISRIFSKWKFGKPISTDDHILVLSWITLTVYTAIIHVATIYGLGYRYVNIAPNDFPYAMKYMTFGNFFAILALQTSKTSFAVTLLRVVTKTWQTWALWAIIITNNTVLGADAIVSIASCNPIAKRWRFELPGKCVPMSDVINFSVFCGIYSGVMDITLAAFPIVLLQPLQMKRKEKIGICVSMSLGLFAGITAFIKSSYLLWLLKWTDQMCKCSPQNKAIVLTVV
ncbi:hypothetical protein DM02DRAFT_664123 [Periconia macrospinosa]|uniref:Rhodopsin domain-containing protein n=1 Tax=Periconia macrospinosa TaxID=97972 RepID=A0A2V1D1F2_9PLEO|nr:hypothetical protein DM02DRAFT_664123 [Periconia macrospinosa]